jgi:hypothetical protein
MFSRLRFSFSLLAFTRQAPREVVEDDFNDDGTKESRGKKACERLMKENERKRRRCRRTRNQSGRTSLPEGASRNEAHPERLKYEHTWLDATSRAQKTNRRRLIFYSNFACATSLIAFSFRPPTIRFVRTSTFIERSACAADVAPSKHNETPLAPSLLSVSMEYGRGMRHAIITEFISGVQVAAISTEPTFHLLFSQFHLQRLTDCHTKQVRPVSVRWSRIDIRGASL